MAKYEGKVIGVTVDDIKLECQGDATLTVTVETETEDPCKALDFEGTDISTSGNKVTWTEPTATEMTWEITGNSSLLIAKTVAEAGYLDFMDKLVTDSNPYVTVEFLLPSDGVGTIGRLFEGFGILTNFSMNAPTSGKATQDYTITGIGKPSWSDVPYVAPTPPTIP